MTSTTDDKEGKKTVSLRGSPSGRPRQSRPHKSDIQKILPQFIGEIWQMPPQFSAIKRGGQKAYKLARAGKKVVLGKRQVLIKEIEILNYSWPYLKIRVVTGSGAYIRSLARDIGKKLKVGGYLANLERTRVGDYSIKDCVNINKL